MNSYDCLTTYEFVCGNSHVSFRSINDGALFGLLHQHHLPKVLTFLFGGWREEVRWNTNLYEWLITYEFVYGNSHVSIRSINDGALFGGRREETREDDNKIRIRLIDLPHTNSYVVTFMYQYVASTTAPYLEADVRRHERMLFFFFTTTNTLVQLQHIRYI